TPLEGYIACGEAVRDMDHRELLPKIKAPTLVIAGKHDPATTPEANEYIKNHIPGARLALLDAAHISNVEQAEAYTNAVVGFWSGAKRRRRGGATSAAPPPAARFWARPGSIAPMPTGIRLTPSGRISSPAAPGARSGRARTSTRVRAACS